MADKILFANIVKSTLAAGITDVATSLAVQAGHGTKFPSPIAGEYFKLKLKDASGNYEITHCTSRSVDTLTIVRGREGTTAKAFAAGDKVEIVVTKETLETFPQRGVAETIDGDKTYSGLSGFTGKTKFANGIGPDYKNNYGLAPSVAAKALTVALVGNDGTNPSAATPVEIAFRSATATSGISVVRAVVAALSVVSPSGATHGFAASATSYLYYYALDNAGTVELAVSGSNQWDEGTLQSTTAIDANSDSATVLYSTTARTNVAIRYLGRVKIQAGAVAGEWDNEDTEVTVHAPGFFNVELTGAPKAPTPAVAAASTEIATAEYVQRALGVGKIPIRGTHLFGIEAQPQNSTYYIGENGLVGASAQTGSTTQANLIWWPVVPVTIRDLYISANALPAAGQTATVTLMKNGVSTSLEAQITDTGGVKSDTTNAITGGPGDYFSFRSVLSATSGVLSLSCSVRMTDPGSGYGISLTPFNSLTSTASDGSANYGLGAARLVYTEPNTYPVIHDKCSIGDYYEQTTSAGTVPFYVRVGTGVTTPKVILKQNTLFLMGADGTELSAIAPRDISLTQSSFFAFTAGADGAAVRRRGSWTLLQKTAGVPNQIKPLYFTSRTQAQATTRYMAGHGCIGHATEATKQFPLSAGVLKNFILLNENAGVDAQTWTANVRINGVQVLQLILTESGTATGQVATNTASSLTVAAGDKLSVELVSSATTDTKSIQFACDHLDA